MSSKIVIELNATSIQLGRLTKKKHAKTDYKFALEMIPLFQVEIGKAS